MTTEKKATTLEDRIAKYRTAPPPMDTVWGWVDLDFDPLTFKAVREVIERDGEDVFAAYIHRAINHFYLLIGVPLYRFPHDHDIPHIKATFDRSVKDGHFFPGTVHLKMKLINIRQLESVSAEKKLTARELVMNALQVWAKIPKGMEYD